MKTRLRSRILAMLAIVALLGVACTQTSTAPTATTQASTQPTTAAKATTQPTAAAPKYSQGASKDTIKIGTTQPMTGLSPITGASALQGMQAAIKAINDEGGINGRKLELVSYDDGLEAPRVVANVKRLTEQDNVFAVLAPSGSTGIASTFDYFKEKGIPLFAPNRPADPNLPNVFLVGTYFDEQQMILMDYLINKQNVKTFGYIYTPSDSTDQYKQIFADFSVKYPGVKLAYSAGIEPTATDVSSVVMNLKNANPDAVFISLPSGQTVLALKEAQKLGWNPMWSGVATVLTSASASAGSMMDKSYSIASTPQLDATTPEMKLFQERMKKYNPDVQAINSQHLEAYGRTLIFAEILKRMGDNLTWDNFIKQAETLDGYKTGIFSPTTLKAGKGGHTGNHGVKIIAFQNQKWVEVSDFLEVPKLK